MHGDSSIGNAFATAIRRRYKTATIFTDVIVLGYWCDGSGCDDTEVSTLKLDLAIYTLLREVKGRLVTSRRVWFDRVLN